MHIRKKNVNADCCVEFEVHSWNNKLVKKADNVYILEDCYAGKEKMKEVQEKKYLVDIISSDGLNRKNM